MIKKKSIIVWCCIIVVLIGVILLYQEWDRARHGFGVVPGGEVEMMRRYNQPDSIK